LSISRPGPQLFDIQLKDFRNDLENPGAPAAALAAEQKILEITLFVHPEGFTVEVTGVDGSPDRRAEVNDPLAWQEISVTMESA